MPNGRKNSLKYAWADRSKKAGREANSSKMDDLNLKNITKKFGEFTAVSHFSLDVKKGEFVSFLGPSGCGKTTTLRMIAGFINPTEGDIFIQGKRVNDTPPHLRDTGMVFQSYALFPHMTVFENIAFGLKYRKIPKREIKDRVNDMLALIQLPDMGKRKPSQLSGGQQQRIALGRALVIQPKILLFDEPLSNLDAKLREDLRVELRQIQREVGITSIFVTHDQEEALSLSDKIAVMDNGEIRQVGTPFEIYEDPDSVFVANFIGQSNFLDGEITAIQNGRATIKIKGGLAISGTAPADIRPGDGVKAMIRAERIRIRPSEVREKGVNTLKASIENISYLGGSVHYYVMMENSRRMMAIEKTGDQKPLRVNDPVFLSFDFKNCLIFKK
ncbi:Spermidine/putrescine import ATP-binding protein PotA [Candidatus Desulfarcum epimagneticum]|uniref:Spermidine/putrescine import ATP-binding protein PotA n=1 Tax=uncultured Desulfobacteraceae bacterium TaxID=218296 RepID=A0A484HKE7_9BACT|nr:Spermidine/putrescine import ATP-binding protein PotA [uncultured Desulfobacteraceae bacterium]